MGGAELRDEGGNSSRYFPGVREANGHAVKGKGPMAETREIQTLRGSAANSWWQDRPKPYNCKKETSHSLQGGPQFQRRPQSQLTLSL